MQGVYGRRYINSGFFYGEWILFSRIAYSTAGAHPREFRVVVHQFGMFLRGVDSIQSACILDGRSPPKGSPGEMERLVILSGTKNPGCFVF